ncbi:related to ATG5 - protein involved in autophagy and the Cvt pathway [Melanopsichium pennsylvanicum]|uniref:Autophagy protein 5 n=1 Tax=Melanopsichium pennsylvanicum TaxID=63383 RepID=A0AAJ4XJ73_9BASI|nr:related to ATG5 - protein involved in autophagy and the Cvt pathway [Melanopsichium pennsylvanicum]
MHGQSNDLVRLFSPNTIIIIRGFGNNNSDGSVASFSPANTAALSSRRGVDANRTMSQPPLASSQRRSSSAGNYPSRSAPPSSTVPIASPSVTSTPILGPASLGQGSPSSYLTPASPHTSGFGSPSVISSYNTVSAIQSTTAFRRLVWEGTIPICVSIDASDLPPGSDPTIDSTYLVVPRISYLPLVVADVKKNLLELVLEGPESNAVNEKELWFEYEGQPLRWHWQIGLLYDYHTANPARTSISYQSITANTSGPGSLRSDAQSLAQKTALAPASVGALPSRLPWKIKLRTTKPPVERLHSNFGLESCKISFMSMIKEADFVRYGSTKKVTNLRKQEQDTLWEGVVNHDYELFWSIANKLVPTAAVSSVEPSAGASCVNRSAIASRTTSLNLEDRSTAPPVQRSLTAQPNESQASLAPSAVSAITSTDSSDPPSTPNPASYGVRSIPIRIFLPDNAPIVQEPVPPMLEDGRPNTLYAVLSALFPLLFPPPPSFGSFQAQAKPLAFAIVQGVSVPLDTEINWLGSALVGADGWVAVVIGLM